MTLGRAWVSTKSGQEDRFKASLNPGFLCLSHNLCFCPHCRVGITIPASRCYLAVTWDCLSGCHECTGALAMMLSETQGFFFFNNSLKGIPTLSPEKWLSVTTHPWTGIVQHHKNDEDVGVPGGLNCCQDPVFALKEKAASIRDHEEELRSFCSGSSGRRGRKWTEGRSTINNNSIYLHWDKLVPAFSVLLKPNISL